ACVVDARHPGLVGPLPHEQPVVTDRRADDGQDAFVDQLVEVAAHVVGGPTRQPRRLAGHELDSPVELHLAEALAHGLFKAGAAAAPSNPRYARRAIQHSAADCEPRLVLEAEGVRETATANGDSSAFSVDVDDDDIADIFYTSGTSGLPKGVVSTHANAAHHS